MRAGELRHQLWLLKPTHTGDGTGQVTTAWGTATVFWGSLEPIRGREFIESGLENSEITARCRMRYYSDVSPDMRILTYDGRTFEIVSVINPAERDREFELMLKELVIA